MPALFEPLASRHDRAAFSCGEPSLDAYIQRYAGQDARRDLAVCYVLCEPGAPEIIGYYTVSAHAVASTDLPLEIARTAGSYSSVPAVLIGRLTVSQKHQGQRLGGRLLLDALRRAADVPVVVKVVVVDALNDAAAAFYEHYGFRRIPDDPRRLYLTMAHVRTLFPAPAAAPAAPPTGVPPPAEAEGRPDE